MSLNSIHAQALLGGCRGFLHADGYTGFDSLYRSTTPDSAPPLIEVACWAHVRRKFYDIHHASASPIALEAMERIAALFVIESSVRGQAPDRRLAVRIQYARPRLDELKLFLEASLKRISGKSALAGAIRYALTRWNALLRYLADGRLEMSNNAAERGMRAPFSVAKITSSVAPMPVDNAPLVFTPSSKLQRCAASIRRPICPMFSDASRIIPSTRSTPCSPGFGQNSPAQASR